MTDGTLHDLIVDKGFDTFTDALKAQCGAEGIDYHHAYTNSAAGAGITVWLNFGNIPATITINVDGTMGFTYFNGGKQFSENFSYCTAHDFYILIDYAFIYLRDGNFDHQQQWYSALQRV